MTPSSYILETIPLDNFGELIFTKNLSSYQELADSLLTASTIKISTFNISSGNEELLSILRKLPNGVKIILVTNIPNRFGHYTSLRARQRAKSQIHDYLTKLSPDNFNDRTEIYINVANHTKMILTDNLAYIGSANFSKESDKNFEAGILINAPAIIEQIGNQFFERLVKRSWRYFGGAAQDLYLELENAAQELEHLVLNIIENNQGVIQNIIMDDHCTKKAVIDPNDLELLGSVTWQVDDISHDIAEILGFTEGQEDLLTTGLEIRLLVEQGSSLETFSGYNIEDETANNFENDWENDQGDNTDELIQRAQEAAIEKQGELFETAAENLAGLSQLLPVYISQLKYLAENVGRIAKIEGYIDNT